MLKDVTIKVLTTLIAGVIIGGGSIAYNSISEKLEKFNTIMESHPNIMVEIENLRVVKIEMEREYRRFKVLSKDNANKLGNRIEILESNSRESEKTLKYCKEWTDYWVNLR